MEKYKCEICGEEFENWQQKANHIRWNHKSEDYKISSNMNSKLANNKVANLKYGEVKEFVVECHNCKKEIVVKEREKLFPKKEKYFCCRGCSNFRVRTEESKLKTSLSIKDSEKVKLANFIRFGERKYSKCSFCNKEIIGEKRKFCDINCKRSFYKKKKTIKQRYVSLAKFKFSLNSFKEEFNFDLIKQYGWYQAKNRGNNLDGISRDHMFSISEGFNQKINPLILAHPANCELLRHSENLSIKNKKCSITLDDLLLKIKDWNKKYGNYYQEEIETYIDLDSI